jgi:hypothetical protein
MTSLAVRPGSAERRGTETLKTLPFAPLYGTVASTSADTVYSELFDLDWPNAPHRVIRNEVVREWEAAGRPSTGQRSGEGTFIGSSSRFVLKIGHPEITPPVTASLEYHSINISTVPAVPSHLTSAAKKLWALCTISARLSTRAPPPIQELCI